MLQGLWFNFGLIGFERVPGFTYVRFGVLRFRAFSHSTSAAASSDRDRKDPYVSYPCFKL